MIHEDTRSRGRKIEMKNNAFLYIFFYPALKIIRGNPSAAYVFGHRTEMIL